MKRLILALVSLAILQLVFIGPTSAHAQASEVKVWKFDLRKGTLTLTLVSRTTSGRQPDTVLSINFTNGNEAVASRDMVGPIIEALKEMPTLGYDPSRLAMISTSLDESEYRDGINRVVKQSGLWKRCIRTKNCWVTAPVASKYLVSVAAYSELDDALGAFGLRRVEVTTEGFSCAKGAGDSFNVKCNGPIYIYTSPAPR